MAYRRLGSGGSVLRRFRGGVRRSIASYPRFGRGGFRPSVRLNPRAVTRRRSMYARRPMREY